MHSPALLKKVKNMPRVPGVYLYKNSIGKIIYIGKAKNLKSRVSSYFQGNLLQGTKTQILVDNISDVSHIEALSELEALILEATLIKKHKPKYNIALKDDKSYLYIVIRNDTIEMNSKSQKIPKVITARETDLLPTDIKFGPYPHGDTARYMSRVIRKSLPYRDCSVSKFNRYKKTNTSCLYGHLGLCSAPCTDETTLTEYKKGITRIKKLLSGKSKALLNDLEKKMKFAAKSEDFEKAAYYRDILSKFNYLRKSFKTAQTYIDNPYLVEDIINQSLEDLVKVIPNLINLPSRIECYDISTLSGTDSVGSMVVATNGRLTNREYRRFKIKKTTDKTDDFSMMAEVLERRLKRELSDAKSVKKWGRPDLIVLDGGKGQLSAVLFVMTALEIKIPIIGLTKKLETIVIPTKHGFDEIRLSRKNEGLKLLQKLRDESHRFAQKYHHELRLKKLT